MTFPTTEVAIIGAGTAGCFMANLFKAASINCCLVEKSRGLGGRCSRRRIEDDGIDLGAPDFSFDGIVDPFIKSKVNEWLKAGDLSHWYKRITNFNHLNKTETIKTLCAAPSMNSWHKKLTANTPLITGSKVHSLKHLSDHWLLLNESGETIIKAKKVVVTCPAEQAFDLLETFEDFSACKIASSKSLPQYVCAISFDDSLNLDTDVYVAGHSIIASAIRENAKPGRYHTALKHETWVIHSTHDWAQQNANIDSQQAAYYLTKAFCDHFGIKALPRSLTSHYWRLARHEKAEYENQNFIWNETLQIGCCGDWLDSGDIPGALNSSYALSKAIIG
jgi:predicted NAD/FAD-dependent oxidoreductase